MTIKVVIQQADAQAPMPSAIVTGIVAQPGGASNATPLTGRINIVMNVTPGSAVILQVLAGGPSQVVMNRCGTGQALQVFPAPGTAFDGQAVNVPVTVSDKSGATFIWDGVSVWFIS